MPLKMPLNTRQRRWWAAGLAVPVVVLAVCEIAGWPFLRVPLQNGLTRAAEVPVTLDGTFRLRLLGPPRMAVEHVRVAPGGGLAAPFLLDAREFTLRWRWLDLWRWQRGAAQGEPLRLRSLRAQTLDAHLLRTADGRATWQLGPQQMVNDPQRTPASAPQFGELVVGQGTIMVDDAPSRTQLKVNIRSKTVTAQAGAAGASAPGAASKNVVPAPQQAAAGADGYEATAVGRWRALPLNLRLRTGGAMSLMQTLEDDGGTAPGPDMPLYVAGEAGAARFVFDGTAGAVLGARRLEGAVQFRGPSLARVGEPLGLTLPQTPPFNMVGHLAHDGGVWRLRADSATTGSSRLKGQFRFDGRTTPGQLTGQLSGQRLALVDLAPAVGRPVQDDGSPAPRSDGRVLPQRRFDLPSLKAMDADVAVAIDTLDFSSTAVAPLSQLRMQVRLQGGVLRLQDMSAQVAGGKFSGHTELDANADPARWTADVRYANVDLAGWLRGVRKDAAPPVTSANDGKLPQAATKAATADSPMQAYLTGTMSGEIKATGRGRSTAEILGSADGQAHLLLRDGTVSHLVTELAGLDVAQALGVLVTKDDPLPLRCARLDLLLKQGLVDTQRGVLDNEDSTVYVAGQINLRDETLDLQATTRPKDFSPFTLRAPLTVTGQLGAPVVGVNAERLAGKALAAVVLGTVLAPAAALLPLIDAGSRPKGDPCADQPNNPDKPAPTPR